MSRSQNSLELKLEKQDGALSLTSPEVGVFTNAVPPGRLVTPGMPLGVVSTLGRSITLLAPAGAVGRISNETPERVHHPVGFGDVLYELVPLDASSAGAIAQEQEEQTSGNVRRAPIAGRFWHRSGPSEPLLAEPGHILTPGKPFGLIEVMKTFSQVVYRAEDGLPERARVVRLLVADGVEVEEGEPLIEVEKA